MSQYTRPQPQVGSKHATRRLTAFTNAPSYFFWVRRGCLGRLRRRVLKPQCFHLSLHQLGPLLKMMDLPTCTHSRVVIEY
jgi:hypothetical protein